MPSDNIILNVQVWDQDFFSADDLVCSNSLNITKIVKYCDQLKTNIKFDQNYISRTMSKEQQSELNLEWKEKDKFWLKMSRRNEETGLIEECGKVLLSLEFLPMNLAETSVVGKGRDEPNVNPYLPPPIGRFEWSLNPFTMLV